MSPTGIAGFAADALKSLTPEQISFIQNLPKAELHAHLNGSIPISVLQKLAKEHVSTPDASLTSKEIEAGIAKLANISLDEIHSFFRLFPPIYALTSNPKSLREAARAVLAQFLDGEHPQCTYLELRSTPRETPAMSRLDYVRSVLDEVERYPKEQAALIVSLDRRMSDDEMKECVQVAKQLKAEGRRVVGIDLCGDPLARNVEDFAIHFAEAKAAGLGVTLHIAETTGNSDEETLKLLSYQPDRLGHATFLSEKAKEVVFKNKICVEICLSSNLLCKTVGILDDHHIRYHLKNDHPVAICTDDILPFRNSLLGEYALLLAQKPLGLGLSEDEVAKIAKTSLEYRFEKST